MIIGVVGAGKARGVSTVALGLGAALSEIGLSSVVIEADLWGGSVAYWRDLEVNAHGVLEVAAAMGATKNVASKADAIGAHGWTHPDAPLCAVLPLVAGGDAIEAQVSTLWGSGQDVFRSYEMSFVFDFGRWGQKLTSTMWAGVDLGVVVSDGSLAGLKRSVALSRSAPLRNEFSTWHVVNGSPWRLEALEAGSGLVVDALLSWDRRGAEAIRVGNWKRGRRSTLGSELVALAKVLTVHGSTMAGATQRAKGGLR